MNKFLFVFSFFVLNTVAFFSQTKVDYLATFDDKKLHYGIYLGLNSTNYKFSYQENGFNRLPGSVSVNDEPGFNVGLIADLRLHKNLNLRLEPGLVTNSKLLTFNNLGVEEVEEEREIENTFLHIPLVFKFSTDRLRNIRPYVLGGISMDYNFSSNENADDNFEGQFRTTTTNFMYEVGIGIDIYLYFFKFSPSIRGVFAINNEIVPDNASNGPSPYTDPIAFMGTRGVFLNFAFE